MFTTAEILREQEAKNRISEMEFNDIENEFIWAAWDGMTFLGKVCHIDWLLTASRKEIKSWIDANY